MASLPWRRCLYCIDYYCSIISECLLTVQTSLYTLFRVVKQYSVKRNILHRHNQKGKAVQAYLREKLSIGSILSEINNKNQLRFLSQKS